MSGGFFGINIGRSSLMANQLAIDITGHNIANVNTEGYSRQRVVAAQASDISLSYGPQGTGVEVDSINRIHETFLERQLARVRNQASYDDQLLVGLEEIQTILNEPQEESINGAMTAFWNSWEALSLNPTDAGYRAQVFDSAERLAREYNTKMTALDDAEKSFNDEIDSLVSEVEGFAQQLAKMNVAISNAETAGKPANDLKDQRDTLILKIADMIGVEPQVAGSNINLKLADGGPFLVNGATSFDLRVSKDVDGMITQIAVENQPLSINSGRIGAFLELRDVVSPDLRTRLSDFMARISDRVNEMHTSGRDLNGRPGLQLFTWKGEATRVTTFPSSGVYDVNLGTAMQTGTHTLAVKAVDQASGALLVKNDFSNLTAGSITLAHTGGNYNGELAINLDYHVKILDANTSANDLGGMRVQLYKGDEAVSDAITLAAGSSSQTLPVFTVDGMNIQVDIDLAGAGSFVKGQRSEGLATTGTVAMDGGVTIPVNHVSATSYSFVGGGDNSYTPGGAARITFDLTRVFKSTAFTAVGSNAVLSVNTAVTSNVANLVAAMAPANGLPPSFGDGEMARKIADISTEKIFEFTGESAADHLGTIVQNLGNQTRQAKVYGTADKSILASLEGQKQSFSGVNLDEEMVLLIQFQRGFEAAARFLTTADSMIETIINRVGRVGL